MGIFHTHRIYLCDTSTERFWKTSKSEIVIKVAIFQPKILLYDILFLKFILNIDLQLNTVKKIDVREPSLSLNVIDNLLVRLSAAM